MQFRRFNDLGIKAFAAYLDALRDNPSAAMPTDLLDNPRLTQPLDPPIKAVPAEFCTRMDFARWLHEASNQSDGELPLKDSGFWAWLSLALFDQVCPRDKAGHRKPGANARHIMESGNWRRRYRHLLQNPFEIFVLHKDDPQRALVVLINPLHKPGELTEQINGRQEVVSCPGCIALATYLYIDPVTQSRRKGASGNSVGRFGKLINQYTRTWDIPIMQPTAAAAILPREFEKFTSLASS